MNSLRKRDYSKLGSTSKIQKQNADPVWNVENEQLQSQAEANSRLRQQITKQSYADSAIQSNIKDKITLLKEKAVQLAQSLESEKRKNIQLQAIIRHMANIREEEKKVEATHRDDMNFQNLDNLFRKIKKLEYDLQQMFAKLNDLQSVNKQKKNQVDAYRTQRVIDSGIFLKIEKQIVQYEIQYKKLLIQKTKFERQYNNNLDKYRRMKKNIQKEQQVILSKRSSNNGQKQQNQQNQQNFFVNAPQIQHALKFTEINNLDPKRKSTFGSKRLLIFENKRQYQYQEMEYAVKKIFVETGVNDAQTLIQLLGNIENINQSLFEEVNKDTDKICELKRSLNEIGLQKQKKTVKYFENEPEPTKTQIKLKQSEIIQKQIKKIEVNSQKINKMLSYFLKTNEIRQVAKIINLKDLSQYNIESLQQLFIELQKKLTPLFVNYKQFKKSSINDDSIVDTKIKQNDAKQQTIQELISKVKKVEQSQKIMGKQDFKRQYEQLRKNQSSGKGRSGKKKTTFVKKH